MGLNSGFKGLKCVTDLLKTLDTDRTPTVLGRRTLS